ncbi:MAG: helicase C-terminal domain-containing protein [Gemmatimonadaceae bacterium]
MIPSDNRLAPAAAAGMRAAISLAGGREVCFVGNVDEAGIVQAARVVARGDVRSVLALPGFAERGDILLHNHPSGRLEPSDADLDVAARLHDGGVGFGIVDNSARRLYVVVEVPRERAAIRIDDHAIGTDLGPSGAIARCLPQYENRPSQREMASTIAALYNDGGIGILEAGTGIGKSLAYLMPALRWSAASGERTVISTNTINLQEQLVGKDLPFLASALSDQPVRFALLKGWRNYVCLLRLEQASSAGSSLFDVAAAGELDSIRVWAARTTDGSLSDMAAPPRPEIWDEVAAEPDLCTRLKCKHFADCFVFQARREASQADVIVVNHHLLMSDLAVRRAKQNWADAAVLPAFRRLIVDEGHHLEDAATRHLGSSVSALALHRLFNRLERRGRGLLGALTQRLESQNDLLSTGSLDLVESRMVPVVAHARERGSLLFNLLGTVLSESGEQILRLTDSFAEHRIWREGLDETLTDLLRQLVSLQDGLRVVRERMELDADANEYVASLVGEISGVARRLDAAGTSLVCALRPPPDSEASVRWMEMRGRDRNVAVTAVPLDVAPALREDLFGRLATAVITSATLTAGNSFDFISGRLGIADRNDDTITRIFSSPFDYGRQAIVVVPTDLPPPNDDPAGHLGAVVTVSADLAAASDGGIFVLFTSHKQLRAAADELRACGIAERWPLLVHGDDSRDALLRRFRESGRAVLLGTASFWEGVDVSGSALRGLVLVKLPFRVPSEPLTAAHCEAIEAQGGDAFREFMIPHAALRLKQGFGRLIRSSTDRGAVVLCDSRVLSKRYGRELLAALPPARRLALPWKEALACLSEFYDSRQTAER